MKIPRGEEGLISDSTSPFVSLPFSDKILWFEPLWVAIWSLPLLFPGRVLPIEWHPWIICIVIGFWLFRLVIQRRILPLTPLNKPIAAILIWLPVAFWASIDKNESWQAIGYLIAGIALLVALVNWPPIRRHPEWIGWAILSFGLILALIGPALFATGTIRFQLPAAYDSMLQLLSPHLSESINPNVFAGALLISLPFAISLTFHFEQIRKHWLGLFSAFLGAGFIGLVVLSGSRAGLFALLVVGALVTTIYWPKTVHILMLGLLIALIGLLMFGFQPLLELVMSDVSLGGLSERLEIWSRAIYALQDFPFTGIGIGTFDRIVPLLYPYFIIPPSNSIPHAHNLYLQIGLDLGLPGLIAWLALILVLFALLIPRVRRRDGSLEWALAVGTLGGLVAMLVHGLLDAVTWGTKLAFYPWMLYALIVLLGQKEVARPTDEASIDTAQV